MWAKWAFESLLPQAALPPAAPLPAALLPARIPLPAVPAGGRAALVVGRGEEADVQLDSPAYPCMLSRRHALLTCEGPGAWHLADLGAPNGTAINRERVRAADGARLLQHGDVVCFGRWAGQVVSEAQYLVHLIGTDWSDPGAVGSEEV